MYKDIRCFLKYFRPLKSGVNLMLVSKRYITKNKPICSVYNEKLIFHYYQYLSYVNILLLPEHQYLSITTLTGSGTNCQQKQPKKQLSMVINGCTQHRLFYSEIKLYFSHKTSYAASFFLVLPRKTNRKPKLEDWWPNCLL